MENKLSDGMKYIYLKEKKCIYRFPFVKTIVAKVNHLVKGLYFCFYFKDYCLT